MRLILQSSPSEGSSTLGSLSTADNQFLCFTLEDQVREIPDHPVKEWKVDGETAIPSGEYQIQYTDSQRFKRKTFQIMNVPGFSGIRFHAGNTDADTEGCILLGLGHLNQRIVNSLKAVQKFEDFLKPFIPEGISIEIRR